MEANHPKPASLSGTPQKKSWRKPIAIGGIAIAAASASPALSQDYERMQRFGMGGGHGGPDMHMQANFRHGMGFGEHRFDRMLGGDRRAIPEQEEKLKAIRDKFLDERRPFRRRVICSRACASRAISFTQLSAEADIASRKASRRVRRFGDRRRSRGTAFSPTFEAERVRRDHSPRAKIRADQLASEPMLPCIGSRDSRHPRSAPRRASGGE